MTDTKTKGFVDCEDIKENTAKFNFEDNTLKLFNFWGSLYLGGAPPNPSRLNWINLQVDFKIEVWIEIGITANKFLYENINAYD